VNPVLEQIYASEVVVDANGQEHRVHSHTSREQCSFIQSIISRIDARTCLEVGLAYGLSSLAICEKIINKDGGVLYSIDPEQDWWKDIGLLNLEKAGYKDVLRFHREYSYETLPKLKAEGIQLDFAYIDASKLFDVVLVDVYYILKMMRIGGVVVLDDCGFPSLNKLARCLANYPHLTVFDTHGEGKPSIRLKAVTAIAQKLPISDKILAERLIVSDKSLGVNAQCVAFQVTANDSRNWDWWKPF
jgi:predicted O-methyltransferase YrrM